MKLVQACMEFQAVPHELIWDGRATETPRATGDAGPNKTGANKVWSAFWSIPVNAAFDRPVAFLHGRVDALGQRALVCIQFVRGDARRSAHFAAILVEQGTPTKWARHEGPDVVFDLRDAAVEEGQLLIYAGQPDPADASHFTIPYKLGEESGVFDGWLEPAPAGSPAWQNWTVRMQRSPGPTPRGAPSGLQTQSAGPQ